MNLDSKRGFRFLPPVLMLIALLPTIAASAADAVAPQAGLTSNVGNAVVVSKADGPQTYGPLTTLLTIPAWSAQSMDGSLIANISYARYSPSTQEMESSVILPEGALLTSIELMGCDSDATGEVVFIAGSIDSNGLAVPLSSLGTTGAAAMPGCGFFPLAMAPVTIDNVNHAYIIVARNLTNTSATNFTAIRAYYTLQVSPAPAVATFPVDVPTGHPFFRYVEALAAAGITAGTGPGQFSPDQPVTRGQMAVFLSVALGLHWAP